MATPDEFIAVINVQLDEAANKQAQAQEAALVKAWLERIERVRKFDEEARKQYARDRRYARGDSGFMISVNLIATYIDILTSFLYAKDPEMDALPAQSATPPTMEAMVQAAIHATGANAMDGSADEVRAMVKAKYDQIKAAYDQRQRDNKAFGETIEIVVGKLWETARLQRHAKRWTRSALTVSVGWLKAGWVTRTGPDPAMQHKPADAQASQARADMLADNAAEGGSAPADLEGAQLQEAQGGVVVHAMQERVLSRGFAIELVAAENMTWDPGVALVDYLDAGWGSERFYMRRDDAQAYYKIPADKIGKAVRWSPRKPVVQDNETAFDMEAIKPEDADKFLSGGSVDANDVEATSPDMDYVHGEEIYDRVNGVFMVAIEGLDFWVQKPAAPDAASRFFPWFNLTLGEVDGSRHAQSKVTRSYKLQDEYNRVRDAFAEHRRRIKPKIIYNKGAVTIDTMTDVVNGEPCEYVGVTLADVQLPLSELFYAAEYPQIDPALYETGSIIAELEKIWGVQEALTQAIKVAKTATESEIQQTGFQARTGSDRDALDNALTDLAIYTAEVALIHMSPKDAQAFAGPSAFWPQGLTHQQLPGLLNLSIRAGSTGKPDNTAKRQAWATLLPLVQVMMTQIGKLRQSPPAELADKLEALLEETFSRTDDHADASRFIPCASPMVTTPPPAPGAPVPALAAAAAAPPLGAAVPSPAPASPPPA